MGIFKRYPLILLALVLGVLFTPLASGEVLFWGLPALQFVPWRTLALDTLRAGAPPLWNMYSGAGTPLFANYQTALLYPLNWLTFFLPVAWSMSLLAVLHLWIGGAGMWAFTGRLGLPTFGRAVSTLAFGLTGYTVARLATYPTVTTAAWLPWLLWAAAGALERGERRDTAWLGLFAALLLLAGHAQTAWYTLLLVGAFTLYRTLRDGRSRPRAAVQRVALVGAGLALGALAAAAQLVPTAELLAQSARANGENVGRVMNFSYGFARTLNLLSPHVFGTPGEGTYITEGAYFEDAAYVGLLTLVAAVAAAFGWLARRHDPQRPAYLRDVPFWWALALVGLVLAWGKNTPIFPFLYDVMPTFNLFQAPVRWLLWAVCALSVLGGIGVAAAWGQGKWRTYWTRLLTAGSIGAVLLAQVVLPPLLPDTLRALDGLQVLVNAVTHTGIIGALIGALHLLQPLADKHGWRWLWTLAALGVLAGDLGYAAWGLNPTVPAAFFDPRPTPGTQRTYWTADAESALQTGRYFTFNDYRTAVQDWQAVRASGLPNLNLLDGSSQFSNFDPLRSGAYERFAGLLDGATGARRDALMRAAGISILYWNDGGQIRTSGIGDVPRAWLVASACWHAGDDAAGAALLADGFDPYTQVHLLGDAGCDPAAGGSAGTVARVTDAPNSTTVAVSAAREGWLVLADSAYPGWDAEICRPDGSGCQSAYIYRANLAFRAVQLPPGDALVRFSYRPAWLLPAAVVSVLAALALLVLFRTRNPDRL